MKVKVERQSDGSFQYKCETNNELIALTTTSANIPRDEHARDRILALFRLHEERYRARLLTVAPAHIGTLGEKS